MIRRSPWRPYGLSDIRLTSVWSVLHITVTLWCGLDEVCLTSEKRALWPINPFSLSGKWHFDQLMQERRNSIANALDLRLSRTNPSIFNYRHIRYQICYVLSHWLRLCSDRFVVYTENNVHCSCVVLFRWGLVLISFTYFVQVSSPVLG